MMPSELSVGVDFGTCWSSVAVRHSDAEGARIDHVREKGSPSPSIPSAVAAGHDGQMVFGARAWRRRGLPGMAAVEFKRDFGERATSQVGDEELSPFDLTALFLGHLHGLASELAGGSEAMAGATVTVTVPVGYTSPLRELMADAASRAGFAEVSILAEPVAGARLALSQTGVRSGELVMVYDLGGGTFDAALMRVPPDGGDVEPIADAGDKGIGGRNFDALIYREVVAHPDAQALVDALSSEDRRERLEADATLQDFVREAKHALSEEAVFEGLIPFTRGGYYELVRGVFDRMARNDIDKTIETCLTMLARVGLDWAALDRVVLVGGATRMPIVRDRLEANVACPVQSVANPELAVADGATMVVRSTARLSTPTVASAVDPVGAYLTDHPAGSKVVGEVIEHHQDHLVIRLADGVDARLKRPASLANLGVGQRRRVIIKKRTPGTALRVALPQRTSTAKSVPAAPATPPGSAEILAGKPLSVFEFSGPAVVCPVSPTILVAAGRWDRNAVYIDPAKHARGSTVTGHGNRLPTGGDLARAQRVTAAGDVVVTGTDNGLVEVWRDGHHLGYVGKTRSVLGSLRSQGIVSVAAHEETDSSVLYVAFVRESHDCELWTYNLRNGQSSKVKGTTGSAAVVVGATTTMVDLTTTGAIYRYVGGVDKIRSDVIALAAFAPVGRLAVLGTDYLALYSDVGGTIRHDFERAPEPSTAVAFLDADHVVCAGREHFSVFAAEDGTVVSRADRDGSVITGISTNTGINAEAAAKVALVTCGKKVELWKVKTG